jgi:hypothetical protein
MPENTNIKVSVNKRLRPIRLAFLVPVSSQTALRSALEIASSIWGGRFCCLIPIFGRTPKSWDDPPLRAPAAKVILRGYIQAFEPDFVVNLTGKNYTEDALGLDGEDGAISPRVISADRLFDETKSEVASYGISLGAVIDSLYAKTFRFQLRHPPKAILPVTEDEKFAPFLGACFGTLLGGADGELAKAYLDALDAKKQEIEPQRFFEYFRQEFLFPLRVGSLDLDVSRTGFSLGPSLLFMDARSTQDIIDYWNLRAIGRPVLPFPKQWAEELRGPVSEFIHANDLPLRNNPQIRQMTTFIRSRSVSMEEMEAYVKSLGAVGSLSMQRWYPRMWDDWARDKDHVVRCDVTATRGSDEAQLEDGVARFPGLSPDLGDQIRLGDGPQWINTFSIRRYPNDGKVATVIPEGTRGVGRLFRFASIDPMWTTSEGLTIGCSLVDREHFVRMPLPLGMVETWAKSHGYSMQQSAAGRITSSMLESIKQIYGTWLFANIELLKLLNSMAHGTVELLSDDADGNDKKKARAKVIHRSTLVSLLMRISEGGKRRSATDWLSALVDHRVMRVGLLLQCPSCSQRTWFGLGEITPKLTCERCLNEFPFPASSPPKDDWYYKATGPFSTEDFAQGSYAVLLAVRCLTQTHHAEMTWLPGVILKRGSQSLEADFVAFRQEGMFSPKASVTMLGECKTFDTFKKKDVRRMEQLGIQLPGAVLVFCTLRNELTRSERTLISRLARKGRKHLHSDRWRNPVLVLTGMELLDSSGIPHCWRNLPVPAKTIVASYRGYQHGYEGLQELANCLQQLHLGMESYWIWAEKDRAKRLARRQARRQAGPAPRAKAQ